MQPNVNNDVIIEGDGVLIEVPAAPIDSIVREMHAVIERHDYASLNVALGKQP